MAQIEKGTAASNYNDTTSGTEPADGVSLKFDMSSETSAPDSITGGSAAANFQVSPMYDATEITTMNKVDGKSRANQTPGTAAANYPLKSETGTGPSTNDKANG